MRDLSIIIPARNERWLARTIQDVLEHIEADTEIIAILDGAWAEPGIPQHERVTVVYLPESIGQRAATNLGARISTATYVMKLDGHCGTDQGFDRKLIEAAKELGPDVTQIPAQWNLKIYDYVCKKCGRREDQAPVRTACPACDSTELDIDVVWQKRRHTSNWYLDKDLRFCYGSDKKQVGDICDVMTSLGACFFMSRERFWELGGLDTNHGSWGQFGAEIGLKSWLSGGRHVVNRRTWFSHFFRVGGIGFPYPISGSDQEKARSYSRDLWLNNRWPKQTRPLAWLIDKFAPAPGWHDVDPGAVVRINEAADAFRVRLSPPSSMANHAAPVTVNSGRQDVSDMAVSSTGAQGGQSVSSQDVVSVVHQSEVGGIAAVPSIADVVEHWDANAVALGNRLNQPSEHDPVCQVGFLIDGDTSVASGNRAIPQPAICGQIASDLGEDAPESVSVEEWNGEILLGSHASASIADVRLGADAAFPRSAAPSILSKYPTKSIVYYSSCDISADVWYASQESIQRSGLPVVAVMLNGSKTDDHYWVGATNVTLDRERSYLTMFSQILVGLELAQSEFVFFCEHDVLYHPSHFDFTPPNHTQVFYNQNVWKVNAETGQALHYLCSQTSGLCASRELLLEHYRKRVAIVEAQGFSRKMGFEPGTHRRAERVDDLTARTWMSEFPNVDIRHSHNLTPSRWKKEQFRDQRYTAGWTESQSIPGWGVTKGRFREFLQEAVSVQQAVA